MKLLVTVVIINVKHGEVSEMYFSSYTKHYILKGALWGKPRINKIILSACSCVVFSGFPATAYGPVAAAAVAAARGSGRGTRGRGGGYTAYGQNAGAGKRSVCILCGLTLSPCSCSLLWSGLLFFNLQQTSIQFTHPDTLTDAVYTACKVEGED